MGRQPRRYSKKSGDGGDRKEYRYTYPNPGTLDKLKLWHDANIITMPDYPVGVNVIGGIAYNVNNVSEPELLATFKNAIDSISETDRALLLSRYAWPHNLPALISHNEGKEIPAEIRKILATAMLKTLKKHAREIREIA